MRQTKTACHEVTLAILAGGMGSRMGSAKGELRIGDRSILSCLLDRVSWEGPTLLVTAPGREHPTDWERFDREATDPVAEQGPLRGLLTALEAAATEVVILAAVDMPMIERKAIEWLIAALDRYPDAPGLMIQHPVEGEDRLEPFPSIFRRTARDMVRERMESGRRSLHGLAKDGGIRAVSVPVDWPASLWINLNHPADLAAFVTDL